MNVNHALSLNVSYASVPPTLHMIQGDSNSRSIVAALFSGASPFNIPAGTSVMVRFGKPDGTGGLYDTTESGSPVVFSGNTVTAPVAAQMLSVPGVVVAQIEVYSAATEESPAYRLASFCFFVDVEKSAYPDDTIISSDYYNILSESIQQALQYSQISQSSAKDAEAWAVGQRGGVDVPSTDPAYNNSAKYWAQNAGTINLETSRVTGTLPLSKGGTGGATAAAARKNLGLGALATKGSVSLAGSDVSGTLPIGKGGTGETSVAGILKALGIKDYITEQGTSGIWRYRKWESGVAECWGEYTDENVSITTALGQIYDSTAMYGYYNYPSGLFVAAPVEQVTASAGGSGSALWIETYLEATAERTGKWKYASATASSAITVRVTMYSVGRWK